MPYKMESNETICVSYRSVILRTTTFHEQRFSDCLFQDSSDCHPYVDEFAYLCRCSFGKFCTSGLWILKLILKNHKMRKEEYCKDDRSPVTDEPLWDTFRSTGSRRVFRELFMSWYSDLSRYAAYWLPDMSDAEEVVLDFFMHLWLHRTAVNISSTFKGYALMSVRNRCISKLRGGEYGICRC